MDVDTSGGTGHVERVLFDAYDQMMAMDEVADEDEADAWDRAHIPTDAELLAELNGRVL